MSQRTISLSIILIIFATSCSLLEVSPIYVPIDKNNWEEEDKTIHQKSYLRYLMDTTSTDSVLIDVSGNVDMLKIIAFGPAYIPIIPNFILPFQKNPEDSFYLDLTFTGKGVTDSLFENISFIFNGKQIIQPTKIGAYYRTETLMGNKYVFKNPFKKIKKVEFILKRDNYNQRICLTRKSKIIYTPFFIN